MLYNIMLADDQNALITLVRIDFEGDTIVRLLLIRNI